MATSIEADCKLILYTDDSAILFAHKVPKVISQKLSKVMETCSEWLIDYKLSLHLCKTECVLFGSQRKLKRVEHFTIFCKDHQIKSQDSVKYHGLFIDKYLNCEKI